MPLDKLARQSDHFARVTHAFSNARSALSAFLAAVAFEPNDRILLPAYIGWSEKEGSGVFDPVRELKIPFGFYRVDSRLRIDLDHLEQTLRSQRVKVLILIHYFGYIDPEYQNAIALARRFGALIVEDEAHAMLSDLVGGECGRMGDACIFSLHKMLPMTNGGSLILNRSTVPIAPAAMMPECKGNHPWRYDLVAIARARRENAERLHDLLQPLREYVEPLWGRPRPGEVPQTYPVLIHRVSRDRLYFAMNDAGFGVVSLYHTMIKPIAEGNYPESVKLSRTILNLPVHQDIAPDDLDALVRQLEICLKTLS